VRPSSSRSTRPRFVALTLAALLRAPLLAASALAAACAHPRSVTMRAVDPLGRFDYTSAADGQEVRGTIVIARSDSAYTVVMNTGGMTRDILFQRASLEGDRLTASTTTPAGALVALHVRFEGDSITGDWAMGPRTGTLRGVRSATTQ